MIIHIFTLILMALTYYRLLKRLKSRMNLLDTRKDLLDFNWEKGSYYLVSLKKEQELDINLFYKATYKIEKKYKMPVQLYWIDEVELEKYSILAKAKIIEIPCLFFLNAKGEIEYDDIFRFI